MIDTDLINLILIKDYIKEIGDTLVQHNIDGFYIFGDGLPNFIKNTSTKINIFVVVPLKNNQALETFVIKYGHITKYNDIFVCKSFPYRYPGYSTFYAGKIYFIPNTKDLPIEQIVDNYKLLGFVKKSSEWYYNDLNFWGSPEFVEKLKG